MTRFLRSTQSDGEIITLPSTPSLHKVYQTSLLDAFLVIWLPEDLVQEHTKLKTLDWVVPLSAWPSTAWALSKDDNFVAQSLLCLTLVIIGVRTSDVNVLAEASRQYDYVLSQFQARVSFLAARGYSPAQDGYVASLAAAGFCCSQIEYILQSWSNGDRHLEGMAGLLQVCGPEVLKNETIGKIFFDHCLLWMSCCVTHRQGSIYCAWPWNDDNWKGLTSVCGYGQDLLACVGNLPAILGQFDQLYEQSAFDEMTSVLVELGDIITNLQQLEHTPVVWQDSSATDRVKRQILLASAMARGYTSGFLIHAAATAWKAVRHPTLGNLVKEAVPSLTEESLRDLFERGVPHLCRSVDELSNGRFALVASSPLLFLLDTAWIGYRVRAEYEGHDVVSVIPWFRQVGRQISSTGYRPLREPWAPE